MKRDRSLRFDDLEDRRLLSHVHAAHALSRAARPAATTISLTGTLSVDQKPTASTTISNPDGSTTTYVAVTGNLGGMGQVHGIWTENTDSFGYYQGPDTLNLRSASGSIVLEFNNQNTTSPRGRGPAVYQHREILSTGTGAYAHTRESGTITVTTNASRNSVLTLTIHS